MKSDGVPRLARKTLGRTPVAVWTRSDASRQGQGSEGLCQTDARERLDVLTPRRSSLRWRRFEYSDREFVYVAELGGAGKRLASASLTRCSLKGGSYFIGS